MSAPAVREFHRPVEASSRSQSDVGTPEEWLNAFRVLQGAEVWGNHGMWVRQEQPSFGPGIRERFDMASKITESDIQKAAALREKVCFAVDS